MSTMKIRKEITYNILHKGNEITWRIKDSPVQVESSIPPCRKRKTVGFPSSKGMNELISAVLLIAIVLVIAAVVLNGATTLTKKEQALISNKTLDCTTADISIESIFIDLSGNVSRVSVRNSGFVGDKLTDGALLNTIGQESPNITAFPIDFPRGSVQTIEFNISGKITACANFSRAIITTLCTSDDQSRPVTCT